MRTGNKRWTTNISLSATGNAMNTSTSSETVPLNTQATKVSDITQKDGFTTVTGRKKNPPRKKNPDPKPKISTKNSYEILNQLPEDEEIQDPHKEQQQGKGKNQTPSSSSPNHEINPEERGGIDGDTLMQLDDRDLAGIDLEKLEEALNQKDLHALPEEKL
jgi:hypothetical protein